MSAEIKSEPLAFPGDDTKPRRSFSDKHARNSGGEWRTITLLIPDWNQANDIHRDNGPGHT
jgi:hypothetical protein